MDKGGPALLSSCPSVCRGGVCPVSLSGGRRGKPRLYGKTTLFLNNNQFFICGHQHFAARRRNHHHIFIISSLHTSNSRRYSLISRPTISERSCPEQKTFPAAARITARTARSRPTASRQSISSSINSSDSALRRCGRFSVINAVGPSDWMPML